MLEQLSTYFRLLVCLLLSLGMHVGTVLFDWTPHAATTVAGQRSVTVSLVSTAALPRNIEPPPIVAGSPTPVATAPPRPAPPLTVPAPEVKPLPEPKPVVDTPVQELSCTTPREMVASPPPEECETGVAEPSTPAESPATITTATEPAGGEGAFAADLLVDAAPDYRSNPLPEYPYLARQKRWEGVVWLQVDVSADGRVDALEVERSSGYRVLDRSARQTVKRWRFTPASSAGVAVASRVRIPVRFRLDED